MNVRILLAAIVLAALGFAAYQATQLAGRTTHNPVAAAPAAPPPPSNAPPARSAGTDPYKIATVEEHQPGVDAPYEATQARRILPEEVKARLDRGQKIAFVDTRADVPDALIAGAVQVPEDKIERWAASVPKSSFVVVYCTCPNETTAVREVLALQKLGFKSAFALRDGLLGWQALGLPTEPPRPGPAS